MSIISQKNLTDNQKDIILQLCLEEIPELIDQNNAHVKELINNMCKNLENAYHYKVATMEKNELVNLNCNNLINLNNLITSGSHLMLRQNQMLTWVPKKQKFKWIMDARCINYHLEMLIFAFNERKINIMEFRKTFMIIKPFVSGNKQTVDIVVLGTKGNKKKDGPKPNRVYWSKFDI